MSIPTPTRDLDALAAFFGDGEWTLPDESPWDGADFDARACVARLRAEVERLTEQGKQDAAIIDGLVGDLQALDLARIEVLAKLDAHKREATRLRDRVDEERAAKDEARKNLCRKVVMTARDLPVRVRREDATDAMCSDSAEVADAWGWDYLYPEATP